MDKTLEQEHEILETSPEQEGDPFQDIFFDPNPGEYIIETPRARWQFTVKGLSTYETEEIGSGISKEVEMDPTTKKPIVRLSPGEYNFQLVLTGVTRAACNGKPFSWNEETVQRLQSWIRDELLVEIRKRSDGMEAFKKNSGTS